MDDQPADPALGRRRRRRSWLVVGLVVLLGALGTGLSTAALHNSTRAWSERAFDQKADVIAAVVMVELIQYQASLTDLAASMGAQSQLTAGTFAAITKPVNGSRLPGAIEVSFVVPATVAAAPRVQDEWRERGSHGLTLRTAPELPGEHYFPVLSGSLDGNPPDLGTDLTSVPAIVEALHGARDGGEVTTSSTFGPANTFIMAAAVRTAADQFRGWVTITYTGREFLGTPPGIIAGDQVGIEFADVSRDTPVIVTTWPSTARAHDAIAARSMEMPGARRQWLVTVRPTVKLLPPSEAWLARGAAGIGSVLTLLLAALTATVVTSRDRALRRVDQATTELRDDITRREKVEQQLRRREEELVGFAGVVAHDLRSPLANVIGYAELIDTAPDDGMSARQRDHLTRVRTSAGRMQELIDDLLAYATAENTTLRVSEIDLEEMVEIILAERLGATGGIRIERSTLPSVFGDPSQVRQVLDNLIGNAIKYTPFNRAAEITIRATPTARGMCRIEVADRGIGIPEKQRAEIFNAFTRAEGSEKYPGTGLGLAIVQRILERHGGAVGVEENPGGGSLFWFTLPAV